MKKLLIITVSVLVLLAMVSCGSSKITMEEAIVIATSHAELTKNDVDINRSAIENNVYKIDFSYNDMQYAYEVDLNNGKIIGFSITPKTTAQVDDISESSISESSISESSTTPSSSTAATTSEISLEKAKEIALEHAKLTENDVVFIKTKKELDDGKWQYDLEFYHNNIEYDYDIDAVTGDIISFDQDIENFTPGTQIENRISQDDAKKIAVDHAKLNISDVSFKKIEIDHDNGVLVYEIEFYHNNIEYEYEINASTGDIKSFDID